MVGGGGDAPVRLTTFQIGFAKLSKLFDCLVGEMRRGEEVGVWRGGRSARVIIVIRCICIKLLSLAVFLCGACRSSKRAIQLFDLFVARAAPANVLISCRPMTSSKPTALLDEIKELGHCPLRK